MAIEGNEKQNQESKKLSYDELNKAASELSMQLQSLSRQMGLERQKHQQELQECNMFNVFKRLEFLFKVIENAAMFPTTFVDNVVQEIIALITIPQKQEEGKEQLDSKDNENK